MASLFRSLKKGSSFLYNSIATGLQTQVNSALSATQTRGLGYKDRMMMKDIKRRETLRQFAAERTRLQTLKANSILPKAVKEMAGEQLRSMHLDTKLGHVNDRCGMTSRAANCMSRWRISRLVWRSLADYNQLSGVQRATWGAPTRNAITFIYKRHRPTFSNTEGYSQQEVITKDGTRKNYTFRFVD